MKLKVTLILVSAIVLMMLGAGGASAYIGYLMGREALKVVTQPDTDSEQSIDRKKPLGGSYKGLNLIDERTIIVKVYNHIHQKEDSTSKLTKPISQNLEDKSNTDNLIQPEKFPFQNQSGGVTLRITQAKLEGNSVILGVNLKNESPQAVRFLYSFLDVRDETNRPLSAIADGLPGELPPNGQDFKGEFIIPTTLLNNSPTISLTLQDYPEQQLKLQLTSIPVSQ